MTQLTTELAIAQLKWVMDNDPTCNEVYPIVGCPGYYITNRAQVYSFRGNGSGNWSQTGRLIKPIEIPRARPIVHLIVGSHGESRSFGIARLLRCAKRGVAP
jgi:hypothetical protein